MKYAMTAAQLREKMGQGEDQHQKLTKFMEEQARLERVFRPVREMLQANGHGGKVIVPLPPNILNITRMLHWTHQRALKQSYWAQLGTLLLAGLMPRPPEHAPDKVRLTVAYFLHQVSDNDNLQARHKWVLDWLNTQNYIVDDAPRHLAWNELEPQIDRKIQRIEYGFETL